jgi:hypothetical protein
MSYSLARERVIKKRRALTYIYASFYEKAPATEKSSSGRSRLTNDGLRITIESLIMGY